MQVAREIVRRQGFYGLTKGLGLTVCREVPSFGAYFFCYQWFYSNGLELCPNYPISVIMVSLCGHFWNSDKGTLLLKQLF